MTKPDEEIARELVADWFNTATDAMSSGPHERPVITEILINAIAAALSAARREGREKPERCHAPDEAGPLVTISREPDAA